MSARTNSLQDDLRHSQPEFLAGSLPVPFSLAVLLPSPSETLLGVPVFLKTLLCPFSPCFLACPQTHRRPITGLADPFKFLQLLSADLAQGSTLLLSETLPGDQDAVRTCIGGLRDELTVPIEGRGGCRKSANFSSHLSPFLPISKQLPLSNNQ